MITQLSQALAHGWLELERRRDPRGFGNRIYDAWYEHCRLQHLPFVVLRPNNLRYDLFYSGVRLTDAEVKQLDERWCSVLCRKHRGRRVFASNSASEGMFGLCQHTIEDFAKFAIPLILARWALFEKCRSQPVLQ